MPKSKTTTEPRPTRRSHDRARADDDDSSGAMRIVRTRWTDSYAVVGGRVQDDGGGGQPTDRSTCDPADDGRASMVHDNRIRAQCGNWRTDNMTRCDESRPRIGQVDLGNLRPAHGAAHKIERNRDADKGQLRAMH